MEKMASIEVRLRRVADGDSALKDMAEKLDEKDKQLKDSKERYKKLAALTLDAFFFHDYKCMLDANPAFTRLTGYTLDEVNKLPLMEAFKKFVLPEFWPRIQESWENKLLTPYRVEGRNKDGNILLLEIQCGNVQYNGDAYRVCMLRDLTGTVIEKERFKRVHEELYQLYHENPKEFGKRFKAHIDYFTDNAEDD